jgi:multiple sugar transport system permease protein
MSMAQNRIETNIRPFTPIKRRSPFISNEARWAYFFISPFLIGLLIFFIAPAISSFYFAFTDWNGLSLPTFTGFENFKQLLKDTVFLRSLLNTAIFTAGSVPISLVLATLMATLLNQKIRGLVIYRTIYFIPVVTMPVAVGMVWKWLYHSQYGLFNNVLGFFHLPQPMWLLDNHLALFAIILTSVWMTVGNNMVIILAGLQEISSSYYEAADIDGANGWKKFFYITIPLLSPSLFFVLVMSIISSFQVFDLIFMMEGGNSALLDPTRTVVYKIYEDGFTYSHMGYASSEALILFLIILVLTILQMYYQKKWVHY